MILYYRIWVDCITKATSIPANKDNWKFLTMVFMTIAMALDIALILSIVQLHIIGHTFYDIKFNIFPGEKLNSALSFLSLFFLIPLILNYLLIFRNSRYEMLLKKYKSGNGNLFSIFFFGSMLASVIYSWVQ